MAKNGDIFARYFVKFPPTKNQIFPPMGERLDASDGGCSPVVPYISPGATTDANRMQNMS